MLIILFHLRPWKIFFPNNSLDNQLSYNKEVLIDCEYRPEDILPQISVKNLFIELSTPKNITKTGTVIGLLAVIRFSRAFAKPKGILGFGSSDSTQNWISHPRVSLRCGWAKSYRVLG